MVETGDGSLKLVVMRGDARAAEAALRAMVGAEEVRAMGDGAWVVYAAAEAAEVRDLVAGVAGDGAVVFVVEFERWSGFGDEVDRAWLLRRGH